VAGLLLEKQTVNMQTG